MKLALSGIGEIAIQQHVPAIQASEDFDLVATCSRSGSVPGVEAFKNFDQMLKLRDDIEVVSLCQPPGPRTEFAMSALKHGCHVMLEKPPASTISQCMMLQSMAMKQNVSLFASWHSREADQVDYTRDWLATRKLKNIKVVWREDVRRWHAGQQWIWQPGGFGVFDPGINALSILTRILAEPIYLVSAKLEVPQNKQTPIAADLLFAHSQADEVSANFDWRETGAQSWTIEIETDQGSMQLLNGGSQLMIDGEKIQPTGSFNELDTDEASNTLGNEYPKLYRHMAKLIWENKIDMDVAPLQIVADAFMVGERVIVEPFI